MIMNDRSVIYEIQEEAESGPRGRELRGVKLSIDGILAQYKDQLGKIRELQAKLGEVSASARSRDGLIRVVAGAHGELRELHLDPRVYEQMDAPRLAREVVRLAGEAAAGAASRARELAADMSLRELRNSAESLAGLEPGTMTKGFLME